MSNWQCTFYPQISDEILTNPGIGFIAAPSLMGDLEEVRDNRGQLVEKYRFTPTSQTWNHPDSGVYYGTVYWRDIEIEEGYYCWDTFEEKLELAKQMGCTLVARCAPYALAEDIPAWLRERYPKEPDFPFWKIDPNYTEYAECWSRFISVFGERYDGNPYISSVDMALVGAWGEGGGSEFVEPKKLDKIIKAYLDGFRQTPLQMLLHDPVSVDCVRHYRRDIGFRVDCLGDMGGFHGKEWSHMLDFYPQNIENFKMREAWRKAPVLFEACWHMNDWYHSGWDIDYIVEESLKWHISSFNAKQTTVPIAWRDTVSYWLKRMGYRFELRRCRASIEKRLLKVELLLANVGVAPCYHPYPLVVRLLGAGQEHRFQLQDDIRNWMPDEDVLVSRTISLPNDLPPGEYMLSIGIDPQIPGIEPIHLAIQGRDSDGFYPMHTLRVDELGEQGYA